MPDPGTEAQGGDGLVAPANLADGTQVVLRPASPGDGARILDGFRRCSVETRYFRFQSAGYRLTDERLGELTGADQVDHVVWLALDVGMPDRPMIALARFVRRPDDPGTAEIAFIVADDYQGRGVARLLFDALRVAAEVNGVDTFVADVLAENTPMKSLLRNRGARVVSQDGPELTWELDVATSRPGTVDGDGDRAIRAAAVAAATPA